MPIAPPARRMDAWACVSPSQATAETTLREFLERLGEWDQAADNETVQALVLGAIPRGPAQHSLTSAAAEWFSTHKSVANCSHATSHGLRSARFGAWAHPARVR